MSVESEQHILQKRLAQFLVEEAFNTITDEDVLKVNSDGQWTHKGNILTSGMVEVLKKEAVAFNKMGLCAILINEIRYHARLALEKAQTENDIISAKLLSYFTDVLQSKIKKIAEMKKTP